MNIHKITRYLLMLCAFTFLTLTAKGQDGEPLRLAVAGVSHGHLWEVISRLDRGDFKIVGVAEKDDYLREHNGLRDKLDPNLFYADLGEMLDKTHLSGHVRNLGDATVCGRGLRTERHTCYGRKAISRQ